MSVIIFHPKNTEKEIKKDSFDIHSAYRKTKFLYRTFMFLFISSFLTNFFLFLILAHYMMVK
jgi:hypothetical protein